MMHMNTCWYGPASSCHKQVDQQTIVPNVMNVKKHLGPTVGTLQVVVYWLAQLSETGKSCVPSMPF